MPGRNDDSISANCPARGPQFDMLASSPDTLDGRSFVYGGTSFHRCSRKAETGTQWLNLGIARDTNSAFGFHICLAP
jgi:hypothetical protein